MSVRTDTTWELSPTAFLSVCSHDDTKQVSLSHPGHQNPNGRGFAIRFNAAHLPDLLELVKALEDSIQRQEVAAGVS